MLLFVYNGLLMFIVVCFVLDIMGEDNLPHVGKLLLFCLGALAHGTFEGCARYLNNKKIYLFIVIARK